MTFTKVQVYLILGCIVAISVLSFSLGHLISRKSSSQEIQEAEVYRSDAAVVTNEAMEELSKLEERLDAVSGEENADIPPTEPVESRMEAPEPSVEEAKKGDENLVEISMDAELPVQRSVPSEKSGDIRMKTIAENSKTVFSPIFKSTNLQKRIISSNTAKKSTVSGGNGKQIEAKVVKPVLPPFSPSGPEAGRIIKPLPSAPRTEVAVDRSGILEDSLYTIQVATFPSRDEAEELEKLLKKKGHKAYIHKLTRSRSVWYRVRIGGFRTRDDALREVLHIRKKEGLQVRVDRYQKPE